MVVFDCLVTTTVVQAPFPRVMLKVVMPLVASAETVQSEVMSLPAQLTPDDGIADWLDVAKTLAEKFGCLMSQ